MEKKWYLFYEIKSCKQRWIGMSLLERLLYIMVAVFGLFFILLGVVMCVLAAPKDRMMVLFLLLIVAGVILLTMFVTQQSIKEYYVIFEEENVCQSRAGIIWGRKERVPYSNVKFFVEGDVGPWIFPYRSSPEICHKHYGNYINALSADKRVLFAVRYSAELKSFLHQKCVNAKWFDIADWNKRNAASDEIENADKAITTTYQGMIQ